MGKLDKIDDIRHELGDLLDMAKAVKARIDASNLQGELTDAVGAIRTLRQSLRTALGRTSETSADEVSPEQP